MPAQSLSTAKLYPNRARTVSAAYVAARHPLNVRPLGNLLFEKLPDCLSKDSQLGDFARFSEDLMMTIVLFIDDFNSLKALSHTSRVFYVYCYEDDLWKQLYIRKMLALEQKGEEPPELHWKGSWRLSVLGINQKDEAIVQLPDNLVCSDLLFRPFQCSQVDYHKLFEKVIREEEAYHKISLLSQLPLDSSLPPGRISRFPEQYVTPSMFNSQLINKPFIITNSDHKRWPLWNMNSLLGRFADVKFRQEAVQWPLSHFSQYQACNRDESPLYLFDCNSEAMKTLRNEYQAPVIFQEDLFTVFGDCRPDHSWLIIGSQRSGSTFHKDPNNTSAWNTALSGRKLWIIFPPDVIPPGVSTDEEESEVTSPVGLAEWVLSGFYNDSVNSPHVKIGITFPGECMYVPRGWWHAVINLDDSVALTQNFVPQSQLSSVLYFLKNRRKQISGFRPARVIAALKAVIHNHSNKTSEEYEAIQEYCKIYDEENIKSKIRDEDCGEIMESELPPLPVYELFCALLSENNQNEVLKGGLDEMIRKEKLEQKLLRGKSEAWTELSNTGGFSFGFDIEEEEEEQEES